MGELSRDFQLARRIMAPAAAQYIAAQKERGDAPPAPGVAPS